MLKFLLRYFANNEQLITRLSESYPVRRAAQLAISVFFRTKSITQDSEKLLKEKERIMSFAKKIAEEVKAEYKKVKDQQKMK